VVRNFNRHTVVIVYYIWRVICLDSGERNDLYSGLQG
jgi:hypothetical protein